MKSESQTSVAQPWDARIHASVFEFGIEVGQKRRRGGFVLEPVDADLDDGAAQLHSPLDTVDELAMDQFRCLVLIGRPEVMRIGRTKAISPPPRARRLWTHAGVGFVEHKYLLAKAGRSNGRWNGGQLKMA